MHHIIYALYIGIKQDARKLCDDANQRFPSSLWEDEPDIIINQPHNLPLIDHLTSVMWYIGGVIWSVWYNGHNRVCIHGGALLVTWRLFVAMVSAVTITTPQAHVYQSVTDQGLSQERRRWNVIYVTSWLTGWNFIQVSS